MLREMLINSSDINVVGRLLQVESTLLAIESCLLVVPAPYINMTTSSMFTIGIPTTAEERVWAVIKSLSTWTSVYS